LTIFVLGLLGAAVLSLVIHGAVDEAMVNGFEFFKVVVYYLLLVTLVNTPQRLRTFLCWLTVFAAILTLVSVLQFFQVAQLTRVDDLPSKDDPQAGRVEGGGFQIVDVRGSGTVDEEKTYRLAGTGIFNDPNDLCILFVIAIPLSLYWILDGSRGLLRFVWLAPLALFLFALYLTHSRGGFGAVLLSILVLLWGRYGPRAALILGAVVLPALLLVFAGRQTEFTTGDTAQARFQLWNEAFAYLKESPLFGIGMGEYSHRTGVQLVAHNSFIHCYGELGFVGGTLFFGAFALSAYFLFRLSSRKVVIVDPILRYWNPYLFAIIVGFIGLMMSLSRSYIVPTYMILGLVTIQMQMAATHPQPLPFQFGARLLQRLCLASIVFLGIMYVALQVLVRYT
jgi:O-antigen ligase